MKKWIIGLVVIIIVAIIAIMNYAPLKNKVMQQFFATKVYALLNDDEVMNLHQVITKDSSNSRTVMWQSLNDRDDFILEYGTDEEGDLTTVSPQKSVLNIDDKQIYIYSVYLNDLTPNTAYKYRVGYADSRTNWHDLKTADKDNNNFKVLIFPDSQSNDYTDWKNLVMNAWQQNSDSNFFINMGDLVDNGYDLSQWNAWFNSVEAMNTQIPVAPVQVNHEFYTTEWEVDLPIAYDKFFDLPSNGTDKYKNLYYSFDYGDVHFTVLNTQDDEIKEYEPNLLQDEIDWLRQDLASTTKKWKIVLMHRDVLNYSRNAAPLDGISFSRHGETFMPIFDEYNVDAVLTAHLHTYRRRVPIRDFAANDNGTLYILTGIAGNVRYPNLWHKNPLDAYVPPQPETDNYIVMDVNDDSITFNTYLPDNTQIDTVTLQK